jgi:hypothetical protein
MVARLFSKLFGLGSRAVPERFVPPSDGKADPAGLVEFLVYNLAGVRDKVQVETQEDDKGLVIQVHCDKSDMGRIIGKKGKTIGAIRHLATDAAARNQIRIKKIEILEP